MRIDSGSGGNAMDSSSSDSAMGRGLLRYMERNLNLDRQESNSGAPMNAEITLLDSVGAVASISCGEEPSGLARKTVDDVWREIVAGPKAEQKPGLGEMTLEEFLVKAGAVAEEEEEGAKTRRMIVDVKEKGFSGGFSAYKSNSGVVGSGSSIGLDIGGLGAWRGKRSWSLLEPLDKAALQRQRRMIKNRESKARSRERKQAYQVEMETMAMRLEEENDQLLKERLMGDDEIDEVFKSAINAVPQLHLAQVYASHREYCSNLSLICMERNAFSIVDEGGMNQCSNNHMMWEFIHASKSYVVQSDNLALLPSTKIPCLFCRNLSEMSINIYPLALYARHARLSFYFAICLLDTRDKLFIFEFFLHLKSREDENPSSILRLLLQIMESKLKSFKTPSGRSLGEEIVVEFRTEDNTLVPFEFSTPPISYPIHEITRCAKDPKLNITWTGVGGETDISTTFVVENCFDEIKTPMERPTTTSLMFSPSETERLHGNLLCSPIWQIQEMIKSSLNNMTSKLGWLSHCLVQFWAPKQLENKPYLVTFDQAFAIGYPLKELIEFRKRCEDHRYFINDGGMEEGLGPPGRVFQYRVPEYTPDLRLYSSREFPLREYAVHFDLRIYLALPVFYDLNGEFKDQCAGVLEFVGSKQLTSLPKKYGFFEEIREPLQAVNLKLPHSSDYGWVVHIGLGDEMDMFHDIPHLVHVDMWAPCNRCNDNNCMQLQKPHHYPIEDFGFMLNSNRENKGKGIIGMVLASESKACFCANLCEFSITEENRAHVLHRERLTVCFAICLHSSDTGDMPYVFEFFLDQGCKTSGNLCLFLRSLLPMMKEKLKRFRASLERLIGDELVIDVITFGSVSEHDSFRQRELNDPPVRFNIIPHRQQSHVQQTTFQITHDVRDELHSSRGVTGVERNNTYCSDLNTGADVMEGEQQSNTVYGNLNTSRDATETCMELHPNRDAMEDQQINPIHVDSDKEVAAVSKEKGSKDNRKLFNITYEQLEPHFGKPLKEVAEIIGASKATLKRRLPGLGIKRWPWRPNYINDPSLFMASTQGDHVGTSKRPRVVDSTGRNSTLSITRVAEGDDVVTVKATFEGRTVMFEMNASSKMDNLIQEVANRHEIEVGSFKLSYLDEDGDRIELRRDDEMELCIKKMKSSGKTTVKILVKSISK